MAELRQGRGVDAIVALFGTRRRVALGAVRGLTVQATAVARAVTTLFAARMFGTQQRPVGPFQQLVQHLSGQRVFGRAVHRNADRCGYTQPQIGIAQLKRGIANPGPRSRSATSLAVARSVLGMASKEFLAPVAAQDVRFPQVLLHAPGDLLQNVIARIMAVPIVDFLEMVKVDQKQGEAVAIGGDGAVQLHERVVAIVQASQRVEGGKAKLAFQRAALGIGQLLVGNDLFQPQPGFPRGPAARSGHLPRPDQAPLRHWHGPRAAG